MDDIVFVPCTRRPYKQRVDGSVTCPFDVAPYNKQMFDEQFPGIDNEAWLINQNTFKAIKAIIDGITSGRLVESIVGDPSLSALAQIVEPSNLGTNDEDANPSCGHQDKLAKVFPELLESYYPCFITKGGELAKLAGMFCNNPQFWKWLSKTYRQFAYMLNNAGDFREDFSKEAAAIVRNICDINSRAELDSNKQAEKIFHEKFRIPFNKWMEEQLIENNVRANAE